MKQVKQLLLSCFITIPSLLLAGCVSFVDMAQHGFQTKEERLWGLWTCTIDEPAEYEGGMAALLVSEDSYIRNGRFNSLGDLTVTVPYEGELVSVKYSLLATGVWELRDNHLISTIENMKITNHSHPELEERLKISSLFPEKITESGEILELSETHFVVKGLHGTLQQCERYKKEAQ